MPRSNPNTFIEKCIGLNAGLEWPRESEVALPPAGARIRNPESGIQNELGGARAGIRATKAG